MANISILGVRAMEERKNYFTFLKKNNYIKIFFPRPSVGRDLRAAQPSGTSVLRLACHVFYKSLPSYSLRVELRNADILYWRNCSLLVATAGWEKTPIVIPRYCDRIRSGQVPHISYLYLSLSQPLQSKVLQWNCNFLDSWPINNKKTISTKNSRTKGFFVKIKFNFSCNTPIGLWRLINLMMKSVGSASELIGSLVIVRFSFEFKANLSKNVSGIRFIPPPPQTQF